MRFGLLCGSIACGITGLANCIRSSTVGDFSSQSVSPVVVTRSPTAAMFPASIPRRMSSCLFACIRRVARSAHASPWSCCRPVRPAASWPEYTRKPSCPTKGSFMILKARALKGSSSAGRRVTGSCVIRALAGHWCGEEVHHRVEQRLHALVYIAPARALRRSSSRAAALPDIFLRGTGSSLEEEGHRLVVDLACGPRSRACAPRSPPPAACPRLSHARPAAPALPRAHDRFIAQQVHDAGEGVLDAHGRLDETIGLALSRSRICTTQRSMSVPRDWSCRRKRSGGPGTGWLAARSDCGWTPATAQKTATAPSRTRAERSTSTVKSTRPGVSTTSMRVCGRVGVRQTAAGQKQVVAAEVMVMPRSCSCFILVHGCCALVHLADSL